VLESDSFYFYMEEAMQTLETKKTDQTVPPDYDEAASRCIEAHRRIEPIFLTVKELAKLWQVPVSWIYAHTRQSGPDAIPTVRIGKYCRFDRQAVQEWLQARQGGGAV
jgi:excisionase family DNA binding protein